MAEIGVLTNVAQIIGAGLALSKTLYDFAVVLSTAGRDVKDLATDISLFCSVLKQVQSTLTRARAYRLSLSALQAAQDVIDRAQVIFGDLDSTIKNFQKRDSNLDLLARVKWFFTGKRVLLVHEQLKACGTTLQLMLTTLVLAQKVASRRHSPLSEDDEDAQDRLITQQLFLAQRESIDRLTSIEDELEHEEGAPDFAASSPTSMLSPDGVPSEDMARSRHRRNRSSPIINGFMHISEKGPLGQDRRVSTIIRQHFNRLSLVQSIRSSTLPTLDDHRSSILQTDELLRQWTDQRDPLALGLMQAEPELLDDDFLGDREASRNSYVSFATSDTDAMADSELDSTDVRTPPTSADTWLRTSSPSQEQFHRAAGVDTSMTGSVRLRQGSSVPFVSVEDGIVTIRNYLSLLVKRMKLSLEADDEGTAIGSSGRHIYIEAIGEVEQLIERLSSPQHFREDDRAGVADSSSVKGLGIDQNVEESPTETITKNTRHVLQAPEQSNAPIAVDLNLRPPPSGETPSVEIFTSFRVGLEDPCYRVLPAALRKYGIQADWREYALYILYGDQERCCGLEEKPVALFKDLDRDGMKPMFMLRKLAIPSQLPPMQLPPIQLTSTLSASLSETDFWETMKRDLPGFMTE